MTTPFQPEKIVKRFIQEGLKTEENVFDFVSTKIGQFRFRPAHSIAELKEKQNSKVGELFEVFCVLYLEANGYVARLLSEISAEELKTYKLGTKDVGIDIIAIKGDEICAVQCKYRSKTVDKNKRTVHRVTWRDVSTFIALCTTTGPWTKHLVMTNADYVTRYGHRGPKDQTLAKETFRSTSKEKWIEMSIETGNSVSSASGSAGSSTSGTTQTGSTTQTTTQSIDIRALRQLWLDRIMQNKNDQT